MLRLLLQSLDPEHYISLCFPLVHTMICLNYGAYSIRCMEGLILHNNSFVQLTLTLSLLIRFYIKINKSKQINNKILQLTKKPITSKFLNQDKFQIKSHDYKRVNLKTNKIEDILIIPKCFFISNSISLNNLGLVSQF